MTTHGYSEDELVRRLYNDAIDSLDEELELELEDGKDPDKQARKRYFTELFRLQGELVKLQDWLVHSRHKIVILFEGRDARPSSKGCWRAPASNWFSITDDEQEMRFKARIHDPLKQIHLPLRERHEATAAAPRPPI